MYMALKHRGNFHLNSPICTKAELILTINAQFPSDFTNRFPSAIETGNLYSGHSIRTILQPEMVE
jgi:hypothetical protein